MDQESQKKAIDDQPRESEMTNVPNLCANNCGFFGSASTNNLCSKCYRDYLLKQPKVADSFVEKTQKDALVDDQASNENKQHEAQNQGAGQEEKAVQIDEGASSGSRIPANRCSSCRKKVGLAGFKCRCRQTFCSIHRYSDKHNCIFDYKSTAQNAIAKANPVVKPDKIDKI